MTREDQLCLLLARVRPSPEDERRARDILAGPLGWGQFLERVQAHRVSPLVTHHLLGFPGVPDPIRLKLQRDSHANRNRSLRLAQELARLLRLLGKAGISAIPLKGVALAEELYGDVSLRLTGDLDILVQPERAREALEIVRASGYRPDSSPPLFKDLTLRYGKDWTLMGKESQAMLELHWGLVWGGRLEEKLIGEVWREARPVNFFGCPTLALSPEWEFLYLAVHAARHGWIELKWQVDLDALCSRGGIDWEIVKQKAQALGWVDAVELSLGACSAQLGTPAPPGFAPRIPRTLEGFASLQVPSEIAFSARLLPTLSERLRFAAIRLFVPTLADWGFIHLPRFLFFLYYPLRPLRIAWSVMRWSLQAGWEKLTRRRGSSENQFGPQINADQDG